jgi:hypothetical protein
MSKRKYQPGSPWASTSNALRRRKCRTITLSDQAWARLGELAGAGGSRSAILEKMLSPEADEKKDRG